MKKYILLLLLPISVFATDNLFCPTEGAISFTEDPSGTCVDGFYDGQCHKITSGQSWDGITTSYQKIQNNSGQSVKVQCILIKAGRKYSEDVTNWAKNNAILPSTKQYTLPTISPINRNGNCINNCAPIDLNFATKGTLTISKSGNDTVYCPDVILAQGSYETPGGLGARTTIEWIYGNALDSTNSNVKLACYSPGNNNSLNVTVMQNTKKNKDIVLHYEVE
jgi:hypothetical protein